MVTLPEISEVLSAHPGVRRAETAIVRHDGRDVAIAAAELSGYVSGPILLNHVRRELGEDSGLAGVVIVEHMPMADGAVDAGCLASAVAEGRCTLFEDPRDDVERGWRRSGRRRWTCGQSACTTTSWNWAGTSCRPWALSPPSRRSSADRWTCMSS